MKKSLAITAICLVALASIAISAFKKNSDPTMLPPERFVQAMTTKIAAHDFDCSEFTPLQTHACKIYQSALAVAGSTDSEAFKAYYAIEAMNAVPHIASSARYSLMKTLMRDEFNSPGRTANDIARAGYGICGEHGILFTGLLDQAGIKNRMIQLFYTKNGQRNIHVAAEVFINGQWRFFDSTWSAFFLKNPAEPLSFASIAELLSGIKVKPVKNHAQTWGYQYSRSLDPYEYLTANPSVIYGTDSGVIHLSDVSPSDRAVQLNSIPKFIGDKLDDGPYEGVSLAFNPLPGDYQFSIDVRKMACDKLDTAKICISQTCVPLRAAQRIDKKDKAHKVLKFQVHNPDSIYISAPVANRCFIALESIKFSK